MIIIEKTRKTFAVGVDLGKLADGTAFSVVEKVSTDPPSDQSDYHLRYLKSVPGGTPYEDIAGHLLHLLKSEPLSQSKEKTAFGTIRDVCVTVPLIIDQTAAGSWVVDMILKKANRPDARRVAISASHNQGCDVVPKPERISLLQALLGTKQLKFAAALSETKLLADALINYQDQKTHAMPLPDTGREHQSDDLVFAVALACWSLKKEFQFSCDWIQ